MEIISKQMKLPLIIIVWSPNPDDSDIKIKKVSKIIYSDMQSEFSKGLHYSFKKVCELSDTPNILKECLNNG